MINKDTLRQRLFGHEYEFYNGVDGNADPTETDARQWAAEILGKVVEIETLLAEVGDKRLQAEAYKLANKITRWLDQGVS